jgi:uncharacterized protein (TIGR02246 family)
MHWKRILVFALLALVVLGGGFTPAQEKAAAEPKREPDRVAIEKLTKDMIQAFDKRDAAAIAACWTEEGAFIHNDGEPIRGRAEIQKGYEEFFRTLKGKPKLEIQSDALDFPSADMAVKQTTLRLKGDEGEVVASGRQDTVLAREGGRWKVAIVREWDREVGRDASLEQLDWLIGTWQAIAKDREVTVIYERDKNQAFIRGTFTVKEGSRVIESGTEMIAKDNAKGVIRSWLFQSDGAFGDAVWSREGKKWSIDVHGVKADGTELTGTVVYIRIDPNTFTWQAVNLALDGEQVADTPPIKAAKQQPAK